MATSTSKARPRRSSGAARSRAGRLLGAVTGSRWFDLALALVTLATAGVVYSSTAARVGYNTDEGQWVASSGYFRLLFLERQLRGPAWEPNYHTLTQPPLTRYVMGGSLWAAGQGPPPLDIRYRAAEVNPATRGRYWQPETYKDERKLAEERRVDRPSTEVLQAARFPMVVLATLGAGLMFLIGRLLAGPVAGLIAAAMAIWNPSMLTLLPRAHAEAPLYFCTLAALLLGLLAARAGGTRQAIWLGIGCGVMAGLAAACKLTGMTLVAGLAGYSLVALLLWLVKRTIGPAVAWRWSALAASIAVVVFVAVNPFLHADPIGRIQGMLALRQQEMFGQRMLSEQEAVPEGLAVRLPLFIDRATVELGTLSKRTGVPFDPPLVALGVLALAWPIVRARRLESLIGPESLMLIVVATVTVAVAVNLGIDWARYYMPMLTLTPLLAGAGAVTALRGLRAIARVT